MFSTVALHPPRSAPWDASRPVLEMFERCVRGDPHHPALTCGAETVSYGELNARANRLAHWLVGQGLSSGHLVGIHLNRSIALVTAALAVFKAGGGYVPVDPANPTRRAAWMFADAGVQLVLCGTEHAAELRDLGVNAVPLDTLHLGGLPETCPRPAQYPDEIAYVIYTSGSTGRPKGVMVGHRALANLLCWITDRFALGPGDQTGMVCSPGFDAAIYELWPSLVSGAAIDIPGDDVLLTPEATIEWLAQRRITVVLLPTPLAEPTLRERWPTDLALRTLLTGGDVLHLRPEPQLSFQFVNNYGPTENTVISTSGVVSPDGGNLPPIGTAVPGTVVEIFDDDLRPVADGAVGEIYLGGTQLAHGYVGRPGLTADRFVPHPHPASPGERLYRTGDLGRRLPGGDIEFLGRADDQVKLHGNRVELGEVTAALTEHPQVAAAHVVARRDRPGGASLVGYVVPEDPRRLPAASQLREHLGQRLPRYMLPSAFVILDALPRNTAGKVDRAALPPPGLRRVAESRHHVPPGTDTERAVAEIWQEVLGLERVGARHNFFDLGGHSLVAMQIIARVKALLDVEMAIRDVFTCDTVATFASAVDKARGAGCVTALPPIRPGSGLARSPLSAAQQQVWFINELAPGNTAYHAQVTIRVTGRFEPDVLARALTELTRRHESLRTTYEEGADGPVQVVHEPVPFPLERIDLSQLSATERETRLAGVIRAELATPFDLRRLPLTRWTAVKLAPEEHELILVEHHLVHDGWSMSVLMSELEKLYNALLAGEPSHLPGPAVQYRDYVCWQRGLLNSELVQRQLAFWRDRLTGAAPLALPTDRPRPVAERFQGDLLRLELPAGLPGRIRELCRREGVSLYMTMYGAFAALMHRYTGGTDICVASGFANRRLRETEGLIGMLVNPVVLRAKVSGSASFRELLAQAKDLVLDAAAHQECPFPLVVSAMGLERDPSRNPLTQVMFSCHDSPVRNPEFAGAASTIFERGNGTAKMDLNVIVIPRAKSHLGQREHTDDRITVLWEYNTDLFDAQTMHTMSGAFLRLLEGAVADPEVAVARLPVLDNRQAHEILVDWNDPVRHALPRPADPVHRQVEGWARRTPEALAVCDEWEQVDYSALNRRADAVAAALLGPSRPALDLDREHIVGVCLPRSASLIAAELGALKAGAAFLPIDPGTPDDRIRHILAAAGADSLITSIAVRSRLAISLPTVVMEQLAETDAEDHRPEVPPGQDDAAYVIFTSGSTGTPKGVIVTHHAFANLVAWHRSAFDLRPGDRSTAVASPGFDFSIWEVWPALTSGGSLHLPTNSILLSAPSLQRWLLKGRINVALLPTPLAESLFALDWPDSGALRHLHAAGDRLTMWPPADVGFQAHNSYGPTENTAISTSGPVTPADTSARLPDIGTPITGTAVYILDPELNPVPPGAAGEIYLGGAGVARGYINRPHLTADRFVPDPFLGGAGARMYRTGDLARRRPGGGIDFLGRLDAQVQIRGYRIEPSEVTAALREHEAVLEAFTSARTDLAVAGTHLVGYIVPRPGRAVPSAAELRAHLGRILPRYMLPTAFVVLEELPLTNNGKVDRSALRAPVVSPASAEQPRLAIGWERRLARIWERVLDLDQVGAEDGFFDLGGHSLLLARVHRQVQREMGRPVPLVALFEYPTVRAFARYLDAMAASGDDAAGDVLVGAEGPGARRRDARERLGRQRAARAAGATADGMAVPETKTTVRPS